MAKQVITGDMRVWNVLQDFPETYEVFRSHGCPDMRNGIFALSAHIMKINWAAKMHHIQPEMLLADLNRVIQNAEEASEEQPGEETTLH